MRYKNWTSLWNLSKMAQPLTGNWQKLTQMMHATADASQPPDAKGCWTHHDQVWRSHQKQKQIRTTVAAASSRRKPEAHRAQILQNFWSLRITSHSLGSNVGKVHINQTNSLAWLILKSKNCPRTSQERKTRPVEVEIATQI